MNVSQRDRLAFNAMEVNASSIMFSMSHRLVRRWEKSYIPDEVVPVDSDTSGLSFSGLKPAGLQ